MSSGSGESNHLPTFGVGPAYVIVTVGLTVVGIALSVWGIIPQIRPDAALWSLRIVGVLLIAGGIALWVAANFQSKIDQAIESNRLVTTGVYAMVRNPIYSAFALACTGAVLIHGNLVLLVLPFMFWALMTVMMRATEEKWLLARYGDEYTAYCQCVNRCIPWKSRR